MKYCLMICTSLFAFCVGAQTTISPNLLVNKWTEAKIDSVGKVVQADMSLGGWSSLTINDNKTVIYAAAFDCGFGHSRNGTWVLNTKKKTLTFIFTEKVGFMNAPGTVAIKEKEVYTIERLSKTELVLKNKAKKKTLAFLHSENQ